MCFNKNETFFLFFYSDMIRVRCDGASVCAALNLTTSIMNSYNI